MKMKIKIKTIMKMYIHMRMKTKTKMNIITKIIMLINQLHLRLKGAKWRAATGKIQIQI